MSKSQSAAVTLRAESGATSTGSAALRRFDNKTRIGKAVGFLLAGFVGAILFLPVIGVHLFTTWAFPLAGIIACVSTLRTRSSLTAIEGPCPACDASIELGGGRITDPMWDSCPECSRPLQLMLQEP